MNSGFLGGGIGPTAIKRRSGQTELPFPAIENLYARYRADTGCWSDDARTMAAGNGDAVAVWEDLSGNDFHAAQTTSGSRPHRALRDLGYAFDSICFPSGAQTLLIPAEFVLPSRNCTTVVVQRRLPNDTLQCMIGAGASGAATYSHLAYNWTLDAWRSNAVVNGTLNVPSNYTYAIIVSGTNALLEIDGQSQSKSGGDSADSAGGVIGAFGDSALSYKYTGNIAEIIVFNSQLSAGDLAFLRAYLNSRYGAAIGMAAPTDNVVYHGNSLTGGEGATSLQGYPWRVMKQLPLSWTGNIRAVSGKTTPTMISEAAVRVDRFYNVAFAKNISFGWEGTNDLNTQTAATAYGNLESYYQARQAAGWTVIAATILKRNDAGARVGFEADRLTVNENLRTNVAGFCDLLIDFETDARLCDPDDSTYFVDGLHLTDAGYQVVADILTPAILSL